MEERKLNVMVNKVGGNASKSAKNYRVSIPTAWAKEMGINETNRRITASFDGKTIKLEVDEMNYENELKRLEKENGANGNLNVSAYSNKEELLQRLSENADDPKETYEYMKEELDYLADDKKLYSVDIGNGFPTYYDDAKEAYESI